MDNDKRRPHKVKIYGIEHDLLLTDAGAKRYGAAATPAGEVPEDPEVVEEEVVEEKAKALANKRRTPRNKA